MSFPAVLRSAWLPLALLCGLNMLNYIDRYVFSAVLAPVQHDLRLDDAWGGWAASAFMLGYFITAPIFGYLGDRHPRKYLMLGGVAVWSLATAATALAQNFAELFAIRVVIGIGEACFVTMGPSWISDLFAGTRRNTAITLFYVAIPCGSAIGFMFGSHFAQSGDWRNAFWWVGLPGVLVALSLLLLREPPRGEADGLTGRVASPGLTEVLQLLTRRRYLLLVGGYAAQTFSIGAFAVWGPIFLHRLHGQPIGRADTIFGAILALTGFAATLSGGFLANRLRRRTESGYAWLMAASMTAAVPVCLLAVLAPGTNLTLAALGTAMFLLFLPTGPITTEMFEIVPTHLRASAVALCTFFIHLFGDLGSPAVVGTISQKVHATMLAAGSAAAAADVENAIGLRDGVLLLPVVLAVGALLWGALLIVPARERA